MNLRAGRAWATNAVLCGLGLGLVLLSRQLVIEHSRFVIGFSGVSGWSAVLYIAAVVVVMTQPVNRWTFGIVVAFAVVSRMVTLVADPFLSSDIYRYVWDGIVQHAHVNPYRYVPGDDALAFLRAPHQHIFDNINRRDTARTIYPPIAQMIYFAVTWISPTVAMMKAAMFGFECVAFGALVALLRQMGKPREHALLYAWCPLLVWEVGDAGHIDAVVIAFVALALLYRARGNDVLTGVFLGLAVMTKFYPLVLFPALYRRGDWKMPAAVAAVVAVGYAVYSSVGWGVFGYAGGYSQEEGIASGTRYFLLQWAQQWRDFSTIEYMIFCAAVFAAITVWAWMWTSKENVVLSTKPAFLKAATMFAVALMLLFSPHYPWYILWLIPFFTLAPSLPLLVYLMGFFYLFTTALAVPGPKMFLLNRILYGATLAAFFVEMAIRRWGMYRWLHAKGVTASRSIQG